MPEIEAIKKEYEEILQKLSDPGLISDWKNLEVITKKKIFLEKIITKQEELRETKSKIEENKAILSTKEDPELVSLAQEELPSLWKRQKVLEKELKSLLNDGKSEEKGSVIVEIQPGREEMKPACL